MKKRELITTLFEVVGCVLVAVGVASFSLAVGVIVLGVLMVVGGGLSA